MSDVKWIKLSTNIFDDEKIRLIEKLPEGDTMLIIWLKLLVLAGKKNDKGQIYLTKNIPYSVPMLKDIFNRDDKVIMLAINTFISYGMLEQDENNIISIINWEKHQNIDGMEKIKEQNRLRQQKHRDKQKLIENKSDKENNVTVTLRNATDKIREDKTRIELDKNINTSEKEPCSPTTVKLGINVDISREEYDKLVSKLGVKELSHVAEQCEAWCIDKNLKTKSWYRRLLNWIKADYYKPKYEKEKPVKRCECGGEIINGICCDCYERGIYE